MEHAVALHPRDLVLGRYRPLRPLGSGGSGSVWLVRDEHAARDVALKIVPREGKAGSRAEREVEAATRLRHPHCLRALALDRDDRHVYVAYPYVRGHTLRELLRGGGLDDATAVEAGSQVLEALAHAHGKGVVHRDVKPANVILEEGEAVSVRLLDFGLARIDHADTLTAVGDVPGTLGYIAPERLAGHEATGAADVWAVGVLLWEALAGRHPFWAISPLETARRVEAGAPPLAAVRPDLPRKLSRAVDRMLDLDPKRRPRPKAAAHWLRTAAEERTQRTRGVTSRSTLRERVLPAALAGVVAAGTTLVLPFFPAGWPFLLGALAALAALGSPTVGLAFALAMPVLPLGNLALGASVAYVPVAFAWFLLFARDARTGLFFLAGPLLAPLHALALLPLVALRARGALRRAALAVASVLTALAASVLTRSPVPLTGEPPLAAGLAGSESPGAVLDAVLRAVGEHPALPVAALVLAAAAVTAPLARARDLRWIGGWGALFLAALLLAPLPVGGGVEALGLALGACAATALLAYPLIRARG
ncbi:MAG TPA: serine/threonine-protein kinase [Gaiellaceae bacterium]|nr:serine/threonine-protein kinase [Gaiellaceae bacterium]